MQNGKILPPTRHTHFLSDASLTTFSTVIMPHVLERDVVKSVTKRYISFCFLGGLRNSLLSVISMNMPCKGEFPLQQMFSLHHIVAASVVQA